MDDLVEPVITTNMANRCHEKIVEFAGWWKFCRGNPDRQSGPDHPIMYTRVLLSLCLLVCLSGASPVAIALEGWTSFPTNHTVFGIGWFNPCDTTAPVYPVQLNFTYDGALVDSSIRHQSLLMTSYLLVLGGEDEILFNPSEWEKVGFDAATIQFVYGELSMINLVVTNSVEQDGVTTEVQARVTGLNWSLSTVAAFPSHLASGGFFYCNINDTEPEDPGCRKDPCSVYCNDPVSCNNQSLH